MLTIQQLLTGITSLLSIQTILMTWYMAKLYNIEKRVSEIEGRCQERTETIKVLMEKGNV